MICLNTYSSHPTKKKWRRFPHLAPTRCSVGKLHSITEALNGQHDSLCVVLKELHNLLRLPFNWAFKLPVNDCLMDCHEVKATVIASRHVYASVVLHSNLPLLCFLEFYVVQQFKHVN